MRWTSCILFLVGSTLAGWAYAAEGAADQAEGSEAKPARQESGPSESHVRLRFEIVAPEGTQIDDATRRALVRVVQQRINPDGTKDISVRPFGKDQLEVLLPRVDETEAARCLRLIQARGTLEFRIRANTRDHADLIRKADEMPLDKHILREDDEAVAQWVPVRLGRHNSFLPKLDTSEDKLPSGALPPGIRKQRITREIQQGRSEQVEQLEVLVIIDPWSVNGSYLQRCRAEPATGTPGWQVSFTFNNRGGTLFSRLTGANQPAEDGFRRRLGIILDGYLHAAPNLQSTIGRHGRLTGGFKEQEAKDLAAVLNAGALPARLRLVSEELVKGKSKLKEQQ